MNGHTGTSAKRSLKISNYFTCHSAIGGKSQLKIPDLISLEMQLQFMVHH